LKSRKAAIQQQRRVFDDFFKIDEWSCRMSESTTAPIRGGWCSRVATRSQFLLLNLDTNSVVLVEQLTVPVQMARRREVRQRRGAQSAGERAVRSVTLSLFRRRQPLSRRKEGYLNAVREALKG
jgi:hypothetical protein